LPTILSIGNEPGLLASRHRWLEDTGATVTSALPSAGSVLLTEVSVDLLVLCNTVADDRIDALTALLETHHPHAWTLVLGRHHRRLVESEARIVVLMEFAEPKLLVESAQLLLPKLSRNPKADRIWRLLGRFKEAPAPADDGTR
jgi:hypothetical protein